MPPRVAESSNPEEQILKTIRTHAVLALAALSLGTAAHADGPPVSIQFSIGSPPPPVYVAPAYPAPAYPAPAYAPPVMVWMPELGVYVALGAQQPVFYLGGIYYYNYDGRWFTGPRYGGPWRAVAVPPPQLRRFHDRDWDRYQERARERERNPRWRHFRPAPVPQGRGPERGPGDGYDRGRGPGRGPGDHGHGHGPGDH